MCWGISKKKRLYSLYRNAKLALSHLITVPHDAVFPPKNSDELIFTINQAMLVVIEICVENSYCMGHRSKRSQQQYNTGNIGDLCESSQSGEVIEQEEETKDDAVQCSRMGV